MKIHRLYVVRIVCIPMFMNSNADLQTEYSHIRPVPCNKECLQKCCKNSDCKGATGGNRPRASRAETETCGC